MCFSSIFKSYSFTLSSQELLGGIVCDKTRRSQGHMLTTVSPLFKVSSLEWSDGMQDSVQCLRTWGKPSHSDAGWGSLSIKGKPRPWVCVGSFKMYCWSFHWERSQLGHHIEAGGLFEECFCTKGLAIIPVLAAAADRSAILISWIYAESPCHHNYYSHMLIVPHWMANERGYLTSAGKVILFTWL